MPFRITTKNLLQFTDDGSWSQYIRPGKQIRPNVLRSTSLLYRILPTSLGTCRPTFYTFYRSHLRWNSTMRCCFYQPVLGQNAVFHNFAIQFALIQYWQATYFSTKNPISKVVMNNRRLSFCTFSGKRPWKTSQDDKKTLSASAVKVNKFQDAV